MSNLTPSRRTGVVLAALALLAGLAVPTAVAQTADCGEIMDISELRAALEAGPVIGEGLTVVRGTEPQPFTVEVLGVLDDGIAVGRDMIIVDVQADFIDDAGGIWLGMSGSPVYVDGELLGAVAYGLSFVSTSIGGLTPAADLVDLVSLPPGEPPTFAGEPAGSDDGTATVDGALAEEIRSRVEADGGPAFQHEEPQARSDGAGGEGWAAADGSVNLRRLALPLSVSGLRPERLDVLQDLVRDDGREVTAHVGSRADFQQVATTTDVPEPGGNIAVADSYGDLTFAAVGTTTLVCEGRTVGFGHPYAFTGQTLAGASTADAITVVPDPGFAPFKLANIGPVFGTIDQDRTAGVRGRNGDIPDTTPITSFVDDLDGGSRNGRTDVVLPRAVPDLAAFHTLANIDTVIDRIGPGTSTLSVEVTGTGADSGPFTYLRTNRFASPFDIAFDSIFEMLVHLFTLQQFPGEDVTIDAVDIDATLDDAVDAYTVQEVRVGVDGAAPSPVDGFELVVQPGSTLAIEADLTGLEDDAERTATLELVIPEDATGFGFLEVIGGGAAGIPGEDCLFDPAACGGGADVQTAQQLADALAGAPTNDTVVARLHLEQSVPPSEPPQPTPTVTPDPVPTAQPTPTPEPVTGSGSGSDQGDQPAQQPTVPPEPPPPGTPGQNPPVTATAPVDRVVLGGTGIPVFIDGGPCPGCEPRLVRVAGEDRVGTAAAVSAQGFGAAETVVIAPAGDYASALVAAPLAARAGAPVLLTGEGALSPQAAEAITALGAATAILVGQDGQLGGTTEADLAAAGITSVQRLGGGADPFTVAAAVARELGGSHAWLVEGRNADPARGWPDAMSAGPVAALEGSPILLTDRDALPQATADVVAELGITEVTIAGGTSAVAPAVVAALQEQGVVVDRLAGATRYETSVLLADRAVTQGANPLNIWLVTGTAFPDGLSAAPAIAHTGGIMLMVDGTDLAGSPPAAEILAALAFAGPAVTIVGGTAAISPAVEAAIADILGGGGA